MSEFLDSLNASQTLLVMGIASGIGIAFYQAIEELSKGLKKLFEKFRDRRAGKS
jgi:hypothetical protein